jgi:hypothetical protein
MSNQRAEGKTLIAARAPDELWDAVDSWLLKNPGKTVTDFVLAASIEKLQREGIEVDAVAVLRDRRGRLPAPVRPEPNPHYKMGRARRKVNSPLDRARDAFSSRKTASSV